MKLFQLKLKVPTAKPRDPNQATLAAKRNAGGAMRDRKRELKRGDAKHKGRTDEGWLNHKGGTRLFTADASELGSRATFRCPGCADPLRMRYFTPQRDADGDVTEWTLDHTCGARLKVFND